MSAKAVFTTDTLSRIRSTILLRVEECLHPRSTSPKPARGIEQCQHACEEERRYQQVVAGAIVMVGERATFVHVVRQ